ncbi:hypothetical protein GGR53DRAFT_362077 [Hypoxylon sp. FL1150]|nr:hypothetical protein GGR53DRAFT_362077 [Hypoxylon sp. FL1150]
MLRPSLTIFSLLLATAAALPAGTLSSQHANHLETRSSCATQAEQVTNGSDTNGRGVQLENGDSQSRSFFVYANSCDSIPLQYVTLSAGQDAFISLPQGFQGRIVRGTTDVNLDGQPHLLGTWLEIGFDANDAMGYADVSLIRGCDGAVTVAAMDGTGASTGFTQDVLSGAPDDALQANDAGAMVIKATEGLLSAIVSASRDYLASVLGYDKAYIDDFHGNPVIASNNQRFSATFYAGKA